MGAAALAAAEPADTGVAVDDADGARSGGAVVAAAAGALVGWLLQPEVKPPDTTATVRKTARLDA